MALHLAAMSFKILTWQTLWFVLTASLVVFLFKLYRARTFFRKLQKQGLVGSPFSREKAKRLPSHFLKPMPPHHPILGHLRVISSLVRQFPPEAYGNYLAHQIRQAYPHLDEAFYLDLWPLGPTTLAVISPDISNQFMQDRTLLKHGGLRYFLEPITGGLDLVTMEGPTWKRWRAIFNPGFSNNHIITLVPGMVQETLIYRNIFRKAASSGEIFQLEHATLKLAVDIIGEVVMDHKLNSQTSCNDMVAALQSQLNWTSYGIEIYLLKHLNFVRPFVHKYNTWRMNRYINKVLDERYSKIEGKVKSKSIIDLALNSYLAESSSEKSATMDSTFKKLAVAQIKLFIFAGHDTTSIAAIYTYHVLAKNPLALARVRAEHDSVFGPNISDTPYVLASNPRLLKQLTFTLACIKEATRLYPPVASLRQGQPDCFLSSASGAQLPTDDCMIWGNHYGVHHNPRFWQRPEEFLPERWLAREGDPLYPYKNAWRTFEHGPRNCIGQDVALVEIKIMLALTIREFDIADAYAEWDVLKGNKTEKMRLNGERAYMIYRGTGHPADFYPCRVAFKEKS